MAPELNAYEIRPDTNGVKSLRLRLDLDYCICCDWTKGVPGPEGWPDHWMIGVAFLWQGEWLVLEWRPDFYGRVCGKETDGDDLVYQLTGMIGPEFSCLGGSGEEWT